VEDWAVAHHLRASDNPDVVVPPRPEVLNGFEDDDPMDEKLDPKDSHDRAVLADVFDMIGVLMPDVNEVERWTKDEMEEVYEWACAMQQVVMGGKVTVPPRPKLIR
jgi:hypothetical protein